MGVKKHIGIWMDHSFAHFIPLTDDTVTTHRIICEFTHNEKEESLNKSENLMHNKEQQKQGVYYDKITEALKEYDNIVLFGPTTAKNELFNLLKADRHFENVKIEVKQTDKMTENQQHAFVKDHFHSH